MAAPSCVFTIARVAEMLSENEEWLHEPAEQLDPEDGCLGFTIPATERRSHSPNAASKA